MRRKLMQRDVERLKLKPWIESVRSWINVGVEATILEQAERYATNQKLKIWENYVKGQELSNGSTALETKQKRHLCCCHRCTWRWSILSSVGWRPETSFDSEPFCIHVC